ncbi:MAG: histidine phosphatase family protein [Solirubrobacteraceae bacterium]
MLALALGLNPVVDERLTEVDAGDWSGELIAEVTATQPGSWERWRSADPTFRFPGGESVAEQAARVAGRELLDSVVNRQLYAHRQLAWITLDRLEPRRGGATAGPDHGERHGRRGEPELGRDGESGQCSGRHHAVDHRAVDLHVAIVRRGERCELAHVTALAGGAGQRSDRRAGGGRPRRSSASRPSAGRSAGTP